MAINEHIIEGRDNSLLKTEEGIYSYATQLSPAEFGKKIDRYKKLIDSSEKVADKVFADYRDKHNYNNLTDSGKQKIDDKLKTVAVVACAFGTEPRNVDVTRGLLLWQAEQDFIAYGPHKYDLVELDSDEELVGLVVDFANAYHEQYSQGERKHNPVRSIDSDETHRYLRTTANEVYMLLDQLSSVRSENNQY